VGATKSKVWSLEVELAKRGNGHDPPVSRME
jgi:hypothetical protein